MTFKFIICYTISKQHIYVGDIFIQVYVTQVVNNRYMVFIVPDICSSKNPKTCLYVFCSTP